MKNTFGNKIDVLIDLFDEGHLCSGRAALVGYALWLETQSDSIKKHFPYLPDWPWVKSTIEKISDWDENFDRLTIKDRKDFNRYLYLVAKYAGQDKLRLFTQGDWEQILFNLSGQPVCKIYTLAGYFTAYDLRKNITLHDENQLNKVRVTSFINEVMKHDGNLILITSDEHDICAFYHDNKFYLHNSLDDKDLHVFEENNIIEFSKTILTAFEYDHFARINLGFRVFRFDNKVLKIAEPGKLLKSIYPRSISFAPTTDNNFANPVHMASFIGCQSSLKYHLSRQVAVHQRTSVHHSTALDYALSMHRYDIAEILLQHGAKINDLASSDKKTALYFEAMENNIDNVRLLLDHGADPALIMENKEFVNDIKNKRVVFALIKTAYEKNQKTLAKNPNRLFSHSNYQPRNYVATKLHQDKFNKTISRHS